MSSLNFDRELIDEFESMFVSGGDSRTCLRPNGRNKYHSAPRPLQDTILFGSCTSSSVASDGYQAALNFYRQLHAVEDIDLQQEAVSEYFSLTRRELLGYVMKLESHIAQAVITPSGTDAEYIALWVAWLISRKQEVSNIVIGPTELGSGSVMAASGCYFDQQTPTGQDVDVGQPLDPAFSLQVTLHKVSIRDESGSAYGTDVIDKEVTELVQNEIDQGKHVLLHLVAHSKTGIHAPTLKTAYALKERFGDEHLSLVVDAAQGRFSRAGVKKIIEDGFMAIITGSKFFGGPGFCGALVIPKKYEEWLKEETDLPLGLENFISAEMLPNDWSGPRETLEKRSVPRDFDLGVLLRWRASLAEIVRYYHTPSKLRYMVLRAFSGIVPKVFEKSEIIHLIDDVEKTELKKRLLQSNTTVFYFALSDGKGFLAKEALSNIFLWLTLDLSNVIDGLSFDERKCLDYKFQIGQPVVLGNNGDDDVSVLRIAIGGVQISDFAIDMNYGRTLNQRLGCLEYQVELLAKKIEVLVKYYDKIKGYEFNGK